MLVKYFYLVRKCKDTYLNNDENNVQQVSHRGIFLIVLIIMLLTARTLF